MKRITGIALVLAILAALASCGTSVIEPSVNESELSTNTITIWGSYAPSAVVPTARWLGEVDIAWRLLQSDTIANGLFVGDGYLVLQEGTVRKIDTNGEETWHKSYAFTRDAKKMDAVAGELFPTNDGGFVLVCDLQDNGVVQDAPVLARCDSKGKVLWRYDYARLAAPSIKKAISLPGGDIITIGEADPLAGERAGRRAYLSRLSSTGALVWEKKLTFMDFDSIGAQDVVYNAFLLEGKGVVFSGDNSANPSYGVFCMIDFNGKLLWKEIDFAASSTAHTGAALDNAFYFSTYAGQICRLNAKGNMRQFDKPTGSLVGVWNDMLAVQSGGALLFLDKNGKEIMRVPYTEKNVPHPSGALDDAVSYGKIDKIIDTENGFLLVGTNITDYRLDEHILTSYIPWSTERVYSTYDHAGNLLGRYAFALS
ncbi:MAG: hypothetical protein LBN05_08490 [Oscillospiraceae bacterium]|nr:hypothetical protein [Oscillospiraceae bacterium]